MQTAIDVLASAASGYASRQTYADAGTCSSPGIEVSFWTSFKRGVSFAFRFRVNSLLEPSLLLFSDGKATLRVPGSDSPTTYPTVGGAIAAATGISFGAAHNIPRLLMPDSVPGFSVCGLSEPTLLGIETCQGVQCQVVGGLHPETGSPYTLYVSRPSLLLLQILHDDFCVTYSPSEEHGAV